MSGLTYNFEVFSFLIILSTTEFERLIHRPQTAIFARFPNNFPIFALLAQSKAKIIETD